MDDTRFFVLPGNFTGFTQTSTIARARGFRPFTAVPVVNQDTVFALLVVLAIAVALGRG